MTCCTADPVRATLGAADPKKHVNYVLGMVLGVDDLGQEFAYLDNRVRAVVRELIGYGTDRGLAVTLEDTERGPRVRVSTGVAYVPSGQMVCVSGDQCALLNDWLAAHAAELTQRYGAATGATARLAVTLCYRECLTDKVPIPGDPCRSEDLLMSPSRVKDEFSLDLRFSPPVQTEEDAVRELVRWLRAIPMEAGSPPSTIEELSDALRAAASPWLDLSCPPDPASPPDLASPPGSPPHASLPALDLAEPPLGLAIPPDACADYLRAAFLIWVTELRPAWIARFGGCHACGCDEAHDDCVLLAELDVPILAESPGGWTVSDVDPVEKDESRRPYLLHARMTQEWLLANCACDAGVAPPPPPPALPDLGGDLSGPIANGVVEKIQGVDVVAVGANDKQVLTFTGGAWRPGNVTPPPAALDGDITGALNATRLDKIHGVPVVTAGPPALDDVLGFDGANWTPRPINVAAPPLPPLAGDVAGPVGANTLEMIRGVPVDPRAPAANQVLGFDGAKWIPMPINVPAPPLPPLGGDAGGPIGSNVVTGIQSQPVTAPTAADNGAALVFAGNRWDLGRFAPEGKYVEYAPAESGFSLVAAGRFGFEAAGGAVRVGEFLYAAASPPRRPFNELKVNGPPDPAFPYRLEFTFRDYAEFLRAGILIVKATPGFLLPEPRLKRRFPRQGSGTARAFEVMFCEFFDDGFALVIPQTSGLENMASIVAGEIQVEVSWYPAR